MQKMAAVHLEGAVLSDSETDTAHKMLAWC